MERARARLYGVSDVQYKLYEASFSTLLLRVVGLLDRPQPNLIETQRDTAPTTTSTGDTAPPTTDTRDTAPPITDTGDTAPPTTNTRDTAL